jgi:Uma2 family endonuclease
VSLFDQRRRQGRTALESNIRLRPLASDRATYADAVLVCGEYQYHPADPERHTIANPAAVVEVLSDSTADDDKTDRFEHYALAPTLLDYVLVSQDEPRVEVRTRRDGGWFVRSFGLGETIELQAGIRFTVDELYAN